jgi:glycosyltransferase involved in cell wall biosynthesis
MARKVRVLQVIDRVGNAGAEMLLRTLAESIDHSRFELHICGLRPRPGSVTIPALRELGVPVVVLNQRTAYDLPALMTLVRYVRRHKIDLIHTHLLAGDVMGRLAGFVTRRPVISTIHSGRMDLDDEPRRRQWLERWTARLWCRKLVVVSELLREEIAEWFNVPPEQVLAIPNGVDTERFRAGTDCDRAATKQALLGADLPLVANVARLVPQKGQRYLVEAAKLVAARHPDVRIAFVGDGELRADLEKLASDLGVSSNIVFAGFQSDVASILAASDVFTLSSLYEGLPVALLEAMAVGCPVVSTDVGGVSQLVRHGETGLLVPPADPAALANALLECLDDPARARQMGAAGQRHIAQEYGMRTWAHRLEQVYLRELSRRQ